MEEVEEEGDNSPSFQNMTGGAVDQRVHVERANRSDIIDPIHIGPGGSNIVGARLRANDFPPKASPRLVVVRAEILLS